MSNSTCMRFSADVPRRTTIVGHASCKSKISSSSRAATTDREQTSSPIDQLNLNMRVRFAFSCTYETHHRCPRVRTRYVSMGGELEVRDCIPMAILPLEGRSSLRRVLSCVLRRDARAFERKRTRTKMCFLLSLPLSLARAYSSDEEYLHAALLLFHLDLMSVERSRRALKFKTPDEIKNDTIYEIHLFPRKRRPPMKFCAPIGPFASAQLSDADDAVCPFSLSSTRRFHASI